MKSLQKNIPLILALSMLSLMPAWAALSLSQKPLLASTNLPKPNIMLTIDTSGSMNFRHMPESTAKVNGYELTVEGGVIWLEHPDEDKNEQLLTKVERAYFLRGTMPANKAETNTGKLLAQIKLRSPDINTIYYNPRQRYLPWALNSTNRYPDASLKKAYIDPLKQGASDPSVDLSADLTDSYEVCIERDRRGCTKSETRYITFSPGIYYILKPNPESGTKIDPGNTSNYTLYDVNDASQTTFTRFPGRDDCLSKTSCTQAEEQQNFANWFVYYRTRMLLAKAALSEAFYNRGEVARVGWTTIKYAANFRLQDGKDPIKQRVRLLTPQNRQALLTSIQKEWEAEGSTPLRVALDQVGRYFMDESSSLASPWTNDTNKEKAACRRSYNILTTDGYYNDFETLPKDSKDKASVIDAVGDTDRAQDTPYRDKNSGTGYANTLADFAFKYWSEDLQKGIEDKIASTESDPASWQHLTQFTIGIGVNGTMEPTKANLDALTAGTLDWKDPQFPTAATQALADQAKTDDLWHAAVNSRGAFYSVSDSQSLSEAVNDAIGRAESPDLREGGVATTSLTLGILNQKYVSEYVSGSWRGDLYAYDLKTNGSLDNNGKAKWQASTVRPLPADRKLWVWNPDKKGGGASEFTWDTMGTSNQNTLGSDKKDLVNYLRGDTTNEGPSKTQFRSRRGAKLPDFVNATPVYVSNGTSAVIFLGGNGGFAHAFRAQDGVEVFGYMPQGVVKNVGKIAAQNYGIMDGANEHQYLVDGPMSTASVPLGLNQATVLVGTLGGGGKGLYALNVTQPNNLGEQTAIWDNTLPTNSDVGYIFSEPKFGQLPNGKWKIFAGNGYNSTSGKAALLVVDVETGLIDSIPVGTSDANGLGGISIVLNSDQRVVTVYGGDLTGQLWRFDYDTADQKMAAAYQGQPLFTATDSLGNPQPITAAPATFADAGGIRIVFGTGKLLEKPDRDKTTAKLQTVYGVLDKVKPGEPTSAATLFNRTMLTPLTISANKLAGFYDVTRAEQTTKPAGWYMDLTIEPGQRSIYSVIAIDEFALIQTVVPSDPAVPEKCEPAQGNGYNFLLPAEAGAQHINGVYDTDGDGLIDTPAAGYKNKADGTDTVLRDDRKLSIQGTTGDQKAILPCPDPLLCSKSVRDRVWKRLMNPPHHSP